MVIMAVPHVEVEPQEEEEVVVVLFALIACFEQAARETEGVAQGQRLGLALEDVPLPWTPRAEPADPAADPAEPTGSATRVETSILVSSSAWNWPDGLTNGMAERQ